MSDYFNVLFQKFKEADQKEVVLENISHEVFSSLLKLIYGSEIRYDDPVFLPMLVQAKFFQIKGINYEEVATKATIPGENEDPTDESIAEYISMISYIFPDKLPESLIESFEDIGLDPKLFPQVISGAKIQSLKYYEDLRRKHAERLQKYL